MSESRLYQICHDTRLAITEKRYSRKHIYRFNKAAESLIGSWYGTRYTNLMELQFLRTTVTSELSLSLSIVKVLFFLFCFVFHLVLGFVARNGFIQLLMNDVLHKSIARHTLFLNRGLFSI